MKPTKGIAVDGFCSGNPGFGGYRGIDIETNKQLFYHSYELCTNNLTEFIGLVHGLMFIKKTGFEPMVIYTDSQTAIAWFNKKCSNSSLVESGKSKKCLDTLQRCERWLIEQKSLSSVLKWETKLWGEIPADFDRK